MVLSLQSYNCIPFYGLWVVQPRPLHYIPICINIDDHFGWVFFLNIKMPVGISTNMGWWVNILKFPKNTQNWTPGSYFQLVPPLHGKEICISPSHDFEKLMRLFFHYSLFIIFIILLKTNNLFQKEKTNLHFFPDICLGGLDPFEP